MQEYQQKRLPPELHSFTPVCTKSFVGWGFAPDPIGELTALPQIPYMGLKGHISKGTVGGRGRTGGA